MTLFVVELNGQIYSVESAVLSEEQSDKTNSCPLAQDQEPEIWIHKETQVFNT